ncbi:NAD-dependent epimerase/dehydratase family protein [Luteipulveratus mongoliensis]|uniref:UDP-glucose 4-epimerase n=1 Tax=Luteipulveratus mongoliensis TaxID=571913 RepID=A0A0K1JMF8_9MICO|nr:NAD-dependent epimerase/dehydratase family protein [Luteipulveratus mongoliensis]AKU17896.1 NAD-dependent dehydratase [Luteipulveratus mongoliensis]
MRVVVTGGAGFIGQHVVAETLRRGHDVLVLDSLREDVHGQHGCPPSGARLHLGDVRQTYDLDAALPGADVVVHLAAKVGLGVDVSDLPDYASNNDLGTAELLAAMARHRLNRLVLASSMVVYGEGLGRCAEHGPVRGRPRSEYDLAQGQFEPECVRCGAQLSPSLVDEEAPSDPRNAYAASKLAQEHYATSWARETGGSAALLRYHNVYGPGMPQGTPYAGVASIFTSALRDGKAPRVFEDGGQRRDFVHVRDIAAATVTAAERHTGGARAFNVGTGVPRTVGEMAASLAHALHGPTPVVTGDYRLGDVRHITANSARILDELGWMAREDFDKGMAELAGLGQTVSAPAVAAR